MTNYKKHLLRAVTLLAIVAIFSGCTPVEQPKRVWPSPPDIPRIKYTTRYTGPADLEKTSLISDVVLGGRPVTTIVKPMGVHVDNNDKLYIADTALATVFVLDRKKKKAGKLVRYGRSPFGKPMNIVTDDFGNVYVTDLAGSALLVFDAETGQYKRHVAEGQNIFTKPAGLAIDKKKMRLYVSDTKNHQIYVFDIKSDKLIQTIGSRGPGAGQFNFPGHITFDQGSSRLIVSDTMNGRVQVFDSKGRFLLKFGKFGDGPGDFARPKGIAVDSEHNIYVADAAFNNIQIFNDEGQILMAFGGYGSNAGALLLPAGLSIDKDDYIYASDSWNERINVYEFLGDQHKDRKSRGIILEK